MQKFFWPLYTHTFEVQVNFKRNGVLMAYMQGRYKCLACGLRGKLKARFTVHSRCGRCSDYMIVPLQDLMLVTELLVEDTGADIEQAIHDLTKPDGDDCA